MHWNEDLVVEVFYSADVDPADEFLPIVEVSLFQIALHTLH